MVDVRGDAGEEGIDSEVEHAAEEGVAAEDPDVESAAEDIVEDAADVAVGVEAEVTVEVAAGEGVAAEVSDDGAVFARRSSNSGVWQSWQSLSIHPTVAMANFFFNFFLRDLLLRMLLSGTDMGNMSVSSTLPMLYT